MYFIKQNEKILGPFSAKEMLEIAPPFDTMVAYNVTDVWDVAQKLDFTKLSEQEDVQVISSFVDPKEHRRSVLKAKLMMMGIDSSQLVAEASEYFRKMNLMRGWGFDIMHDSNLSDFEKSYLIHALEDYCESNSEKSLSQKTKQLIAKLDDAHYHIGRLVRQIKSELAKDIIHIPTAKEQ